MHDLASLAALNADSTLAGATSLGAELRRQLAGVAVTQAAHAEAVMEEEPPNDGEELLAPPQQQRHGEEEEQGGIVAGEQQQDKDQPLDRGQQQQEQPAAALAQTDLYTASQPAAAAQHTVAPRVIDDDALFTESSAEVITPNSAGRVIPRAPSPVVIPDMAHHASLLTESPVRSGASSPGGGSSGFGGFRRSGSFTSSRRASVDLGAAQFEESHAAQELFYRLNHARQTVDFVKRQAAAFSQLNRASMGVWEALDRCNQLREYEAALLGDELVDSDMSLMEHALQTAELCRLAFPQYEWAGLVGLIHGLGKLLAHATLGSEPQWAVCGESFPVGCRFHPSIMHAPYFQANPDRRRRGYASPTGVYQPGCSLSAVCMSWSGAEYLYMVLAMNRTKLPPEALFLVRYQKFAALLRPGQPYGELLSDFDRSMLPTLRTFMQLAEYRRQEVPGRLEGDELHVHYEALLQKYIPQGSLRW